MAEQEGKYNIKAAASILGIQPGTLRAWERRYKMIAPIRNESGHRLYTDEHIRILKSIIKMINQGFTISQAIGFLDNTTAKIISEQVNLKTGNQLSSLSDELLDSLLHFEESRANEVLNIMFSMFTQEKVVFDVFRLILKKLKVEREAGKLIKPQAHFAHTYISARVLMLTDNLPSAPFFRKVIIVSSGKDIDLLLFTFYLRSRGLDIIPAGPSFFEADIDSMIKLVQPDLFIIFCSSEEKAKGALKLLSYLSLNHKDVRIGLKGNAFSTLKHSKKEDSSSFIIGDGPGEWDQWLSDRMRL